MSEGTVAFELKVFLCAIATKCTLGAHASVLDILYTIFDVSVRSWTEIASFLGLKSRELESRANTKEICEKMTQKIGNCLGIRIGVQIVAWASLNHHFFNAPVKTRKIKWRGA